MTSPACKSGFKATVQPVGDNPAFQIDHELYPFGSRYVELSDGVPIHYVDEGEGPTVLMLHGNPSWSFLYRKMIVRLRGEFRCVAPDLPGFGLSPAPPGYHFSPEEHVARIVEFVSRLDLRGIWVFGQDWGGPIGFGLAAHDPKRIAGFLIGNTFAWPLRNPRAQLFSALMGWFPGPLLAWAYNGVIRFFFTRGVTNPGLSAREWQMYLAPFAARHRRRPTYVFPRYLRKKTAFLSELEARLSALRDKPALFLWGQRDFAFKTDAYQRLKRHFRRNDTVRLHQAGHFLQEDQPDEICKAIRSFVTGQLAEYG